MRTWLVEHTPVCNGIMVNDMVYGSFAVTMMMGTCAPSLSDLMGGCVVVLAAAAEGEE